MVDDVEVGEVHNKYLSSVFTFEEELGNIPVPIQSFLDSEGMGLTQMMFIKEKVVEQLQV